MPNLSILNATVTTTGVSCANANAGSITVNVAGGAPNFTYTWDNGSTTGSGTGTSNPFTLSGLTAGNYVITVTDASGCQAIVNASVGGNLGGQAFNDFQTDGVFDSTDVALPGIKVYLYACNNSVPVDSAVNADADGKYPFAGLNNYPYRVEFSAAASPC